MDGLAGDWIKGNIEQVHNRIARAAVNTGRNPEKIRLLIVTKRQPVEKIEMAIACGAKLFGENYAEEAVTKISSLSSHQALEWHMIGHVQSRKSAMVSQSFDVVESVDSVKLAERLDRSSAEKEKRLKILLEINLSGEESKSGWHCNDDAYWENLLPEITRVVSLPNLEVRGLMTMPPLFDDSNQARPYFKRLVQVQRVLQEKLPLCCWDELSMGTSQDFEVAVEEGATIVRIGRAILGPRPQQ